MISLIRSWILGLAGAALFCALATELTPKGMVKNVLTPLCGVVMALALVAPLLDFDFASYSLNLAKYRENAAALTASAEEISDSLSRTIIEENCETYILDKARSLGLTVSGADVTVRWSGDGYWYPVSAEIAGAYSGELSRLLEAELGIGGENQIWSGNEEA
ncbi:MAG: hypothetical protein ACI4PC_04980 [Oscillospiraceae bacterium]